MSTIILRPFFRYISGKEYSDIIEYGDLPLSVKNEVIQYFQSNEFIREKAENYSLKAISSFKPCNGIKVAYDVKISNITFTMKDNILNVILEGQLTETPYEDLVKRHKDSISFNPEICYMPVTLFDFQESAKDGFHKASIDGPITYGYYLGESSGKYMMYLHRDRTDFFIV